jgi:hypothetical protein
MSSIRRRPQLAVALQLRTHGHSGQSYWAVIAAQSMTTGSVNIQRGYDSAWQEPPKNKDSVEVTFVDELKPTSPDLEGFTVYVTQEWIEDCFLEPTWEEFVRSNVTALGASAGIITGLLPPEGVPLHVSAAREKQKPKDALAGSYTDMLPLLLINVVLAVLFWIVMRYAEGQMFE